MPVTVFDEDIEGFAVDRLGLVPAALVVGNDAEHVIKGPLALTVTGSFQQADRLFLMCSGVIEPTLL